MTVTPTRCACIDVGSNTTALLVADVSPDGTLSVVGAERVFTLLGGAIGPSGIDPEKIDETATAVADLLAVAEQHSCGERVELVGTHVVREAHNSRELEEKILEVTGRSIEVIDGHEEARFSFIGAVGGLARVRGTTVVIDAGGGSTEVASCTPGGEPVTASFTIGSAQLQQKFMASDPPTAEELNAARTEADRVFGEIDLPSECQLALAVGGGASTAQQLTGGVIDLPSIARVLALTTSVD